MIPRGIVARSPLQLADGQQQQRDAEQLQEQGQGC